MHRRSWRGPLASSFSRPLNHAQYGAVLFVVALVILACGIGLLYRQQLAGIGGSFQETHQPDIARLHGSSGGEKGSNQSSSSTTAVGVTKIAFAHSFEATPRGQEEGREQAGQGKGEKKGNETVALCYSSPAADPSAGVWRKSKGGVSESPAAVEGDWTLPTIQFDFLKACMRTWRRQHPGGQETQPYWAWEAEHCALERVTSEKFCSVMEGRKGLLLVGDSLTRLATTTLASILRANPITIGQLQDDWSACGGKLPVRFVRNDFLDTRTTPFGTVQCISQGGKPADNTRCRVFADDRTLVEFDTLVVNSGAHPRPGKEYGAAMNVTSEALSASMKRLHGDDAILVARNTVPGHWGCTERIFDGPTNSNVAADLVSAAPSEYKWSTFHESNALLQEAFSAERGWTLLDVFSPTVLRSDAHIGGKDCLHYCLPGPADHWIILLYHILLAATTVNAQ